jgi:hypothetical protein
MDGRDGIDGMGEFSSILWEIHVNNNETFSPEFSLASKSTIYFTGRNLR